jgi:hypothetical protein
MSSTDEYARMVNLRRRTRDPDVLWLCDAFERLLHEFPGASPHPDGEPQAIAPQANLAAPHPVSNGFDKRAYQRWAMRLRRLAEKESGKRVGPKFKKVFERLKAETPYQGAPKKTKKGAHEQGPRID